MLVGSSLVAILKDARDGGRDVANRLHAHVGENCAPAPSTLTEFPPAVLNWTIVSTAICAC